ncbi:MAG: hypothetical protein CBB60_010065 [Armatimonadetes bacterium Cent15-Ar3]|nr:MAG: hypothetical protein CBB60_010065 [Armatimonadetes bacterium Cent15-Ar3]
MNSDHIATLINTLTDGVRIRLVAYAYKLIRGQVWSEDTDPRELAEDVVSDLVAKTILGERTWNPEENPDPLSHWFSGVKSIVWAKSKNKANKLLTRPWDSMSGLEPSPGQAVADSKLEAEEFFCGLMIHLGDDELCCVLLDLYYRGYAPDEARAELVEKSEQPIAIEQIYAANKRLRRKTSAYQEILHKELANATN